MERLVLFGKGGSGKTTVASNLSTIYRHEGRRVLHVGCDPKRDSLFTLVDELPRVAALDLLLDEERDVFAADLLIPGRLGMDCVDTGGLQVGLGCGGRGVMLVVEAIRKRGLLDDGAYDVALFDVLGDLVCGGFTAPLMPGVGEKVLVVLSDDPMSLYAANGICRAVQTYADNGICLAGFVVNAPQGRPTSGVIEAFAERLSAEILATIPRSRWIPAAEFERRTVVEAHPRSAAARTLRELARRVAEIRPATRRLPTPMDDLELVEFCKTRGARAR